MTDDTLSSDDKGNSSEDIDKLPLGFEDIRGATSNPEGEGDLSPSVKAGGEAVSSEQ